MTVRERRLWVTPKDRWYNYATSVLKRQAPGARQNSGVELTVSLGVRIDRKKKTRLGVRGLDYLDSPPSVDLRSDRTPAAITVCWTLGAISL
jgi:hypothetical protein